MKYIRTKEFGEEKIGGVRMMNERNRKTLDEIYEALKEFNDESIIEIFSLLNFYANQKEKELKQSINKLREEIEEDLPS